MKKFVIRSDMEGLTGVVSYDQVTPGSASYSANCRTLMAELDALIAGLTAGGADEIVIYDEHVQGRNIDLTLLPNHVRVICGKPPYLADWAGGLDAGCTGCILQGLHAMDGTPRAILPHTYEHDIKAIRLNGVLVGEIGVEAAIAGDFGVPLSLVIADSAGAAEARALLPDAAVVETKVAHSFDGGLCYSLGKNTSAIRSAAEHLARQPSRYAAWRVPAPVEMSLIFHDRAYTRALHGLYRMKMKDAQTLVLAGPTVTAVWAEYWQMKLVALAELAN